MLHCSATWDIPIWETLNCMVLFTSRVRKSRYWGETLQVPHPLLWRNEASLLVQWLLCTSPLHCKLLFVYTVCCWRTGQCFSVLRTRNSDVILTLWMAVVGRSYVTDQWHNVPLLRARDLHLSQRPSSSIDGWIWFWMIISYGWGKTPEKPQPGNWSYRGSNPGPLGERVCIIEVHFRSKTGVYSNHVAMIEELKNVIKETVKSTRCLRGNARDSHSGGPGFKFRGLPTWLRFLVVSSVLK